MGRKRKNAVYSFFSYEKTTNTSTCLITGCSSVIKGQHGTNLMYHLMSKHEEEHAIVKRRNQMAQDEDKENNPNASNATPSTSSRENKQVSSNKCFSKFQQECVALVTVHGRPFALMDDVAFKNILSYTIFSQRELQSINAHSIRGLVRKTAEEMRNTIFQEIKYKLICIKVDTATCQDRTFMGVNAQYVSDEQLVLRNLGVIELHSRSTAEFLKEKLLYVLRKYKISVAQIYSITTDNGANMLKLARILNNDLEDSNIEENIEEDIEPNSLQDAVVTLEENSESGNYQISSVHCAAHTLQLAVRDALGEEKYQPVINIARNVVRRLRTPTMRNILKAGNKKIPCLDCATRWHSLLDMLESLVELRDYCSTTPGENFYVSESSWQMIDDLIQALRPAKILTKRLQYEQLTIGDFFYAWTRCFIETNKISLPLAQSICYFMDFRKKALMENSTFVSAIFLDLRFQVILSDTEVSAAIDHIHATWEQYLRVNSSKSEHETQESLDTTEPINEEEDEMENLLARTEQIRRNVQRSRQNPYYFSTRSVLQHFTTQPRLHSKENILKFWKSKSTTDPQLFILANIILATPSTQVSVERLFSSLKFILTALRYNLMDDIVEDILVIRNNSKHCQNIS